MATVIRDPVPADEPVWRRLWAGYCRFYKATVPESVTSRTWQRLLDVQSSIEGRIAEVDGKVVGFSHCIEHAGTWAVEPVIYLEDLFVDESVRGKGVGHALLTDLIERAKARSNGYVYWHTQQGNATARRLYDMVGKVDDFVRYKVDLGA
jgi:GNAT superfamily N-acetyltransferase